MIGLGSVGLFLAIVIGPAPSVLSGWICVTGGFAYFLYAFATRDDGEALWRMLIGFLYIFAGLYLFSFFGPELQLKNVILCGWDDCPVRRRGGILHFFPATIPGGIWLDYFRRDRDCFSGIHYLVFVALQLNAADRRHCEHKVRH